MIKVKLLSPAAKVPTRATTCSAGYDIYAVEDTIVPARSSEVIGTGVAFGIPMGWYGMLTHRSSMAFKLDCVASLGVLDQDFVDEVKIKLFNHGDDAVFIKAGDRIAQVVFMECLQGSQIEIVEELKRTTRSGGLGSTGK